MEKAFILYDLEATCWRTSRPKRVEIIEVGAVKVNEQLEVVSEFCAFVRPMMHPVISKFCTSLTSIRQSDVDGAFLFDEVMEDYEDWMGVLMGITSCLPTPIQSSKSWRTTKTGWVWASKR